MGCVLLKDRLDRRSLYPQVFLTQGLGVGLSAGLTYVPGLGIISHWFSKRRALAVGIATSVSFILSFNLSSTDLEGLLRAQLLEVSFTPSCSMHGSMVL